MITRNFLSFAILPLFSLFDITHINNFLVRITNHVARSSNKRKTSFVDQIFNKSMVTTKLGGVKTHESSE